MPKPRTHYDNLKVARNAPDVVIKAAHKALLQRHHPDKAADKAAAERITRIINEAREVLLDPERRRQHDQWISERERQCQAAAQSTTTQSAAAEPCGADGQPPPAQRHAIGKWVAVSDGTAIDTETGLMWCRFALGQTWRADNVSDHAQAYTWQAAREAAGEFNRRGGFAGFDDWRLPDIGELKTLLDRSLERQDQFIEPRVFPNSPPWAWSSTPYAGYGGGAWFVHFKKGQAINEDTSLGRAVRLVRDHKATD